VLVREDWRAAVRWFAKAAENGDDFALYCLGVAYYFGEGVRKDVRVAKRWLRKAAKAGVEEAEVLLRRCDSGDLIRSEIPFL
jgi:hypothetical protein